MSRVPSDESVVINGLREVWLKCMLAAETSRVWSLLVSLFDVQLWTAFRSRQSNRIGNIAETSRTYQFVTKSAHRLTTAAETSSLRSGFVYIQHATRTSFLYRWLTAEPDPEVIVIDLRETWTVGPIIDVVDRVVRLCSMSTQTSIITTKAKSIEAIFRERPIRILSLILLSGALGTLSIGAIGGTLTVRSAGVLFGLCALALSGLGSKTTLKQLSETRTGTFLIAAFEPPEPPSTDTDDQTATQEPIDDTRSEK